MRWPDRRRSPPRSFDRHVALSTLSREPRRRDHAERRPDRSDKRQEGRARRAAAAVGCGLAQIQKHYDVELTYTSNAIEGNTLTLRETAEVIEHGITVGGKPLRDHLEAVDHYDALIWMRDLAATTAPVTESTIRELHRRIVARSQPGAAGLYSDLPRRIAGSPSSFRTGKDPQLMQQFAIWLTTPSPDPSFAFEAHVRLTAIHPFGDGNGRTARLLMNLLLICNGISAPVGPAPDRKDYLDALEHGSMTEDLEPFQTVLHGRLDSTLGEYLGTLGRCCRRPASQRAAILRTTRIHSAAPYRRRYVSRPGAARGSRRDRGGPSETQMLLSGRSAIVTGAGSGIGRACATAMGREGARVLVVDRDADAGEETAATLRAAGGDALAIAADVTDTAAIEAVVRQAVDLSAASTSCTTTPASRSKARSKAFRWRDSTGPGRSMSGRISTRPGW